MERLRANTEVLIRARVSRQTSAGDHGIETVACWVTNPLTTTRSDREVTVVASPDDVVLPGSEFTALVLLGRLLRASNADLSLHVEDRDEGDDPDVAGHLLVDYTGTDLASAKVDLNAAELALLQQLTSA